MIRTVAVGTDGSGTAAKAVEHAIDLAVRYGARLVLISAYTPAGEQRLRREARVLVEAAGRQAADILVIGNKGMERRLLGSVPNSVSHDAPCSVLIIKTT